MAKKKSASGESYGPFYETYIKRDPEGVEWEQEIPAYREVATSHGRFGVKAGHVLTFEDTIINGERVVMPVQTDKKLKAKRPKKVAAAPAEETPTEE